MTPQTAQMAEPDAPPAASATIQIPGTAEERLLHEYQWLSEGALYGLLTPELQTRMSQVETALDDLDAQSPGAQYMRRQMQRTEAYLTELETKINALPDVKQA